ncbi:MAG: HD domain-containing protein [Nanoarchaeota archaeon]
MDEKKTVDIFYEWGQLKRVRHEGLTLAGVEHPDSVGEHSLRAAQIGFVLAHLEGYANPAEVCAMAVFHDIGECRVGDIHKIANGYIKADEERAVREQLAPLGAAGEQIFSLWRQTECRDTPAGILAKDADWLEMALTAKEYLEQGHAIAQVWIDNVAKAVKTRSAQRLVKALQKRRSTDWWQDLVRL